MTFFSPDRLVTDEPAAVPVEFNDGRLAVSRLGQPFANAATWAMKSDLRKLTKCSPEPQLHGRVSVFCRLSPSRELA